MAAVIVGAGTIWSKAIRPVLKAAATADEMLPLLNDLTREFKGTVHAFAVLDQIIAQFRNDSGSSLRDVIDGLTKASHENALFVQELIAAAGDNRAAALVLEANVEAVKRLSASDRASQAMLMTEVEKLVARVNINVAALNRIETAGAGLPDHITASAESRESLAADLAVAQTAVDHVATDLAQAHVRADATEGVPGEAADAAAKATQAEIKEVLEMDEGA